MSDEIITAEPSAQKVRGKPFQKGEDPRRHIEGRPPGAKSFSTILDLALRKIAEDSGKEPIDIEKELVMKAISEARKGKYQYHKDLFDRKYGQAMNRTDLTTDGKPFISVTQEVVDKYDIETSDQKEDMLL